MNKRKEEKRKRRTRKQRSGDKREESGEGGRKGGGGHRVGEVASIHSSIGSSDERVNKALRVCCVCKHVFVNVCMRVSVHVYKIRFFVYTCISVCGYSTNVPLYVCEVCAYLNERMYIYTYLNGIRIHFFMCKYVCIGSNVVSWSTMEIPA